MTLHISNFTFESKLRKYIKLRRGQAEEAVESSWNVMAHGDAREEKLRGNKKMEWVTIKRHMSGEHRLARAVKILQADVHRSPASSRLNW